jgi:hypothetical protein
MVDRVDLVEEGANSAAFIELYKRKEPLIMTVNEILEELDAEHASVIKSKIAEGETSAKDLAKAKEDLAELNDQLQTAKDDLGKANAKVPCECDGEADENGNCKTCGKKKVAVQKESTAFDEEETLKSLPAGAAEYVRVLKSQRDAAEAAIRKADADAKEAQALAKAADLKSLPIEQTKLVDILKTASTDVIDLLTAANAAMNVTVLNELGKSAAGAASKSEVNATWAKIEAEADKVIAKSGNITKQKAIAEVIKKNPDLYREYVNGGAQ